MSLSCLESSGTSVTIIGWHFPLWPTFFFFYFSGEDAHSTLLGVEVLELLLHTEAGEDAEMEDEEDDVSESRLFLLPISSWPRLVTG